MAKRKEINMDSRLDLFWDGGRYKLSMLYSLDRYPIGGLICEYMRLPLADIKPILMSCNGLKCPGTDGNFHDTFLQFNEKIHAVFPPVISTMIIMEFQKSAENWFKAVRENQTKEFLSLFDKFSGGAKEDIFKDSGYESGDNTVLQIMLISYHEFIEKYKVTKRMFDLIIDSAKKDDETRAIGFEEFIAAYGKQMESQDIDFCLKLTNNGFESFYSIGSSFSLLLFELAHCINMGTNIVKCRNCGHYFVPEGRSDTVYCSYPLREDPNKTCKDVGAKMARAKKEKTDAVTKEYRKVYMKYKMAAYRHPEDTTAAQKIECLKGEAQEWRKEMESGSKSIKAFLEWLRQF